MRALILLLVLLIADDEQMSYENEELGLGLVIPPSWVVRDGDPEGQFKLVIGPQGGPSMLRFSVRVKPSGGESDAAALRDQLIGSLAGRDDLSDVVEMERAVAGREAPGVGLIITVSGAVLRIEQFFLIENRRIYVLESRAPKAEFGKQKKNFAGLLASLSLIAPTEEQLAEEQLTELAGRCGSEVDFAMSWKEAAKRARSEHKLILVRAMMLGGFAMTDPDMVGGFMQPDVIDLVRERYVPFSMHKGMPSPLSDPKNYGIGPNGFGRGLLIATPDGRVVQDGVGDLYSFLLEGLKRDPKYPGAPVRKFDDALLQAEHHLRRGDLELAGEMLAEPETARAYQLLADWHRRHRRGEEALEALAAARSAEGGEALIGDLDVDEAWILLRMERHGEAQAILESILESRPEHGSIAKARYLLGVAFAAMEDGVQAEGAWGELIERDPDSRWAWQAAGVLTSTGFQAKGKVSTGWLAEAVYAAQAQTTFEPLGVSSARKAKKQAVEWLLAHQRDDGSWISPAERGTAASPEPIDFTLAITAIAGQALLGYGSQEHADAVEHAVQAVEAIHDEFLAREPVRYFMDYAVWSRSFLLSFLLECIEAGVRERGELGERIDTIIGELQASQKADGGWSYYVTGDLDSTQESTMASMTFTTAAVLLPLLRADELGFDVPADVLERGLDLLSNTQNGDGTFEYTFRPAAARGSQVAGSAGRGPLCTLALLKGGRAEVTDLRVALDLFVRHRDSYTRERGKSLMHCGSQAQGSHYLTFDYAFAAKAVSLLPRRKRSRYRDAVLESVLSGRSDEGAYLDNPLTGRALGTAFAVWAFRDLE